MLSIVIDPVMAAPAAMVRVPSNRHLAEDVEVAPNVFLAVFVAICAISPCEPMATTPRVSSMDRHNI